MHLRRLTFLSFFCLLLCHPPGCLYIPQGHKNIELRGTKIGEEKLGFLVPGKTTKAEFIEKVGRPYLMMDDYGVMAYHWKMLKGYIPFFVPGYTGVLAGVGQVSKNYLLLLSYDDKGVITRYETIQSFASKPVNEQAIEWVGRGEILHRFTPVKIPEGKSVVYVYQRRFFGGGAKPDERITGVFLNGDLWAELLGGEYAVMVLPPGCYRIGVEPSIRSSEKFLNPNRAYQLAPETTTTLDTQADKAYYLTINLPMDYRKGKGVFIARPPEEEALRVLAKLKRVR
jgi:hypothetical protein